MTTFYIILVQKGEKVNPTAQPDDVSFDFQPPAPSTLEFPKKM